MPLRGPIARSRASAAHRAAQIPFFKTGCDDRPVRQIREGFKRSSQGRASRQRPPRDFDPRRARAQSQKYRRRYSARPPGRVHRPVRLGQILARLRHRLCRGPAPLRREPVRLCAAIPGDDAEAGRRPDRRAVAGDFHRAENHLAQSALHRRHRHRDLRLYAAVMGAGRRALFARHRLADREPDHLADGRSHPGAAGRHAALSLGARRCAGARASTARNSPTL